MSDFFGYGNLASPYWFIGKEEGGGASLEENFQRILVWEKLGKSLTVDSIQYHQALGFTEKDLQKIQPTWTKLIQVLLELEEKDSLDKELRRHYQRHVLGRVASNHCVIELMPMASRSTGLWLWKDIFTEYFGLKNRRDYFAKIVPQRKQLIKELIAKHQPKLVLFYSTQVDYLPHWREISSVADFSSKKLSDKFTFYWKKTPSTLYVITPHPTAHGLTVNDFQSIGRFIRENL